MSDARTQLRRHQRGGYGGVHIAVDQHEVRGFRDAYRFEAFHDCRRLVGMRSGAHAERVVGTRQIQITEERIGHLRVVVLSRVNDDMARGARRERPGDGRELHEVRPRTDDREDGRSATGGAQKILVSV